MLNNFADKTTDEYAIDKARSLLDEEEFDDAIALINPVLARNPGNSDIAYIAAAAYAGRAGLRVLDLFTSLAGGETAMFKIFAAHMEGATTSTVDDMVYAISIIESLGYPSYLRSDSINFFSLFLYYAQIGVILNKNAYTTANEVSATFDACNASSLPELDNEALAITIAKILDTLDHIGGKTSGLDTSSFPSTFTDVPLGCPGAGAVAVKCKAMRTLVNDGSVGLNSGSACP